jgi:anti-anti-sigma factor
MKITRQQISASQNVIQLDGRLDAVSCFQVKEMLAIIFEEQVQPQIIINLENVPFIDSSGLVALVSGLRLAREKNGQIILSGVQPQAEVVFQLTMLDKIFEIYPTYSEAMLKLT